MRAAPRDEFSKGNEWKIYDYVTRHFIGNIVATSMVFKIFYVFYHFLASLHDDAEYVERKLLMDLNGFPFSLTWHEMTDRGFLFAMPWKQRSMQLNEVNLNTRNLGEGMQLPVGGLNTEALFTKPPDYLQVRFTTS